MTIFRDVLVDGRVVDVRIVHDRIAAIGPALAPDGTAEITGNRAAALIPGLHDHHIHLLATAAAASSVQCGPPHVRSAEQLAAALAAAPGSGWVRGVGYDETVAGELDRRGLDALIADRPTRVQHRGGSLWVINSAGLQLLGRDAPAEGRLWRRDRWLRERLGEAALPDLAPLGTQLAAFGVTGVTDASPGGPGSAGALSSAVRAIPQRVLSLADTSGTDLEPGPRKIVLSDHELPTYDELVGLVRSAHAQGRPVAVHSVTRTSLTMMLAVWEQVGAVTGDRVEHAAVAPPDVVDALARHGIAVVTQPSLVARRGDDYLARCEPDDVEHLWRFATMREVGITVVCSSDAPYGDHDPWATIVAARDRMTASGRVLGRQDRVSATEALESFLAPPLDLQSGPRRLGVAADADLVLLDAPLDRVLSAPTSARVKLTMIGGTVAYARGAA